jgi:hypothetical protein
VTRYELVTDLCPPALCVRPAGQPLRQALDDAWVVYRHRVLPAELRDGLPGVDHSWGNFSDGPLGGTALVAEAPFPTTPTGEPDVLARVRPMWATSDGRARGQAGVLLLQIDQIPAGPSLNVIHVALPHQSYELTPGVGSTATRGPPRRCRSDRPIRATSSHSVSCGHTSSSRSVRSTGWSDTWSGGSRHSEPGRRRRW